MLGCSVKKLISDRQFLSLEPLKPDLLFPLGVVGGLLPALAEILNLPQALVGQL